MVLSCPEMSASSAAVVPVPLIAISRRAAAHLLGAAGDGLHAGGDLTGGHVNRGEPGSVFVKSAERESRMIWADRVSRPGKKIRPQL
jgi:hypothetical protein